MCAYVLYPTFVYADEDPYGICAVIATPLPVYVTTTKATRLIKLCINVPCVICRLLLITLII